MENYFLILSVVGLATLGMTWIPTIAAKYRISYSIVYLAAGIVLYLLFDELPWPNPFYNNAETIHLTELVVIIALMGTGLKIDHPFSFRHWQVPFRLVSVAMILSIVGLIACALVMLGFDWASALLLGAVLAPTDPVLASDVQVGPPNDGKDEPVRFSLTAEAGLNDGMAFPFTWLAILVAGGATGSSLVADWLGFYVLFKIVVGLGVGYIAGKGVIFLFFHLPEKYNALHVRDGLIALSTTLLTYGVTELAHGYGFIAVFVAAVTIRNFEIDHEYHETLHAFTDQIERILLAILLLLFGGSLVEGILEPLTWPMALVGLLFVFIIRPVATWLSLLGTDLTATRKGMISFFGIRGVGSFFYLSFALGNTDFAYGKEIWALTAFVVLVSILLHGLTASTMMNKFVSTDK
ncbi:cation:proton antiporter [Alteromonas ponticola]|uniref:Sodium:proton antiporter n=1 Tax=Alteromonas ponticola TaxID=2720613 RepID=A0ABX1R3T5_9ALTE|nr:sodium:proton antiporter [Alteromonas ponticola]NMH60581.1 sodium:proton antiporter [Alteromonas ponticola]